MIKYITIESKQSIKSDESIILSVFSEFIKVESIETGTHHINLYYNHETDVLFSEVILNMMSDTLTDLRIYVSHQFDTLDQLTFHQAYIKRKMSDIPFNKYVYLDDKIILRHFIKAIDQEMKRMFLRKFELDHPMIESIKTYLESDQNMSLAAKKLYVHRNTLIQRIDKFFQVTGFDIRLFNDAFLIYHLLI